MVESPAPHTVNLSSIRLAHLTPRDAYLQRQAQFEALRTRYASVDARLGTLRLLAAAFIIVTIFLTATGPHIAQPWLLLPIGLFVALVTYHLSVRRKRTHAERAVA